MPRLQHPHHREARRHTVWTPEIPRQRCVWLPLERDNPTRHSSALIRKRRPRVLVTAAHTAAGSAPAGSSPKLSAAHIGTPRVRFVPDADTRGFPAATKRGGRPAGRSLELAESSYGNTTRIKPRHSQASLQPPGGLSPSPLRPIDFQLV